MPAKAPKTAPKVIVHPVTLTIEGDELVATGAGQTARGKIPAAPAPALVKILILRSHPLYAYSAGDTGEVSAADAEFLVGGGFAQAHK